MVIRMLLGIGALALLLCGPAAAADRVTLKDGTVVEGSVLKYGSDYHIYLSNGTKRVISESQVASIGRGSPAAAGAFASTRARAERVEAPIVAVTIWENFVEANPDAPELPAAKVELEKWQRLHRDNAERINGKWVGGVERRRILTEVAKLCAEAREQLENQTLQAIEKYEKALKLYPNCFEANFALGYYYLRKGALGPDGRANMAELDKAVTALEASVRLRPKSPSALSNLAIGYSFRGRYEAAILKAYEAARLMDNRPIVENLVNALARAPEGMRRNNSKIRTISAEAAVLAQKYGTSSQGTGHFRYIAPERTTVVSSLTPSDRDGPVGIIGNGSGFLVSADGYLITNRHVIEEQNCLFRVRLEDGTERPAEVIAIDSIHDIALLKIRHDRGLPYLKLAAADLPNPGAPCMVLGYPIANRLDFNMQVTSGEISATSTTDEYQVTLVANTTHGNSGGPIVDRDGNVIGVLSAGTSAFNATYLRAVSAGQIRDFLDRAKEKHSAKVESVNPVSTPFDAEALALQARPATVMVMIIRDDARAAP